MKKLIIVIFLISTTILLKAQIEQEIKSFQDSIVLLADKGKSLILKYAREGRHEKVAEIYKYLNDRVDDPYMRVYTYSSELYVLLLGQQWKQWIEKSVDCNRYLDAKLYPGVEDYTDQFFYELQDRIPELRLDIRGADLPPEDTAMLSIFLNLIESGKADDSYKDAMKKFKRKYPSTKYDDFINYYLPVVKTRFIISSEIGGKVFIPTGNLGENLAGSGGFYINGTFQIEKVYIGLYVGIGGLSSNYAMEAESEGQLVNFDEGDSFSVYEYKLNLGYSLFEKYRLRVTPYGSFGYTMMHSPTFNQGEEDSYFEVFNTTSFGPGVSLALNLFKFEYRTFYGNVLPSRLDLVVNGSYIFMPEIEENLFRGNMAYFNVSST